MTQRNFAGMARHMTARVRKEYKIHGYQEDRYVVTISIRDIPVLTLSWPHETISTEVAVEGNED